MAWRCGPHVLALPYVLCLSPRKYDSERSRISPRRNSSAHLGSARYVYRLRRISRRCVRFHSLIALRDSLYSLADLLAREIQLVGALQVHPEVGGHAEILSEAKGCVRCHVLLACQDLIEAVRRHLDNVGQLLGRESDLLELVDEDFSGMNGRVCHCFSLQFIQAGKWGQ